MLNLGVVIVAVALGLAGCSGIQVSQDYDPQPLFGIRQTFAWSTDKQPETGDPRIDNPLRDDRTRAAVERVLAAKGLHPSTTGKADFLIAYQYALRRKWDPPAPAAASVSGLAATAAMAASASEPAIAFALQQ